MTEPVKSRLEAIELIPGHMVGPLRRMIAVKNPADDELGHAAVFADAVHRMLDRKLPRIAPDIRRDLKTMMFMEALHKTDFEIGGMDVIRASSMMGDSRPEVIIAAHAWACHVTGDYIPQNDFEALCEEVNPRRRLVREHRCQSDTDIQVAEEEEILSPEAFEALEPVAWMYPRTMECVISGLDRATQALSSWVEVCRNAPAQVVAACCRLLDRLWHEVHQCGLHLGDDMAMLFRRVRQQMQSPPSEVMLGAELAVLTEVPELQESPVPERVMPSVPAQAEAPKAAQTRQPVPAGKQTKPSVTHVRGMLANGWTVSLAEEPRFQTTSGRRLHRGRTLTADPAVIPPGTRVFLEFPEPCQRYNGTYMADHSAPWVRGQHIEVYLGPEVPQSQLFYSQPVKVHILE